MRERWSVGAMRLGIFLLSLGVAVLMASSVGAALKKYGVARQSISQGIDASPKANYNTQNSTGSMALIDDSGGNPVLEKLVIAWDLHTTAHFPPLTNGFIFFSQHSTEGPSGGQVGSGSMASSIIWGNLDGWTISGSTWCHAVPSFICDIGSAQDSETTDPQFLSSNYDMGTWTFHATGWTMNLGYIVRTNPTTGLGNLMYFLRGVRVYDGTVPALPLLGIAGVSVSVFALGLTVIRRRGR